MRNQTAIWTAVAILAAGAALSFWYGLRHAGQRGLALPPPQTRDDGPTEGKRRGAKINGGVALRYATAVQENNCDEVLRMLWWVQERLETLRTEGATEAELDSEREHLCERLLDRTVPDNQLDEEGVADAYIFVPGATIEPIEIDEGATNLAKPVHERVWLRVTYPLIDHALRDKAGRAVRSLVAGINVSADGYVLKAGIEGNVEIDRQSLTYQWPSG